MLTRQEALCSPEIRIGIRILHDVIQRLRPALERDMWLSFVRLWYRRGQCDRSPIHLPVPPLLPIPPLLRS